MTRSVLGGRLIGLIRALSTPTHVYNGKNISTGLITGLLLSLMLFSTAWAADPRSGKIYVINLLSSTDVITKADVPRLDALENLTVYTSRFQSKGRDWNRLSAGFFSRWSDAKKVLLEVREDVPGAWIAKITTREKEAARENILQRPSKPQQLPPTPVVDVVPPAPKALQVEPPPQVSAPVRKKIAIPRSGMVYVINMLSSTKPITKQDIPELVELEDLTVYTSKFKSQGLDWNRLRAGFFTRWPDAKETLLVIRRAIPGAWIAKVPAGEIDNAQESIIDLRRDLTPDSPKAAIIVEKSFQRLDHRLEDARRAISQDKQEKALGILKRITKTRKEPETREATELLGVVYEKMGAFDLAQNTYRKHLSRYPKSKEKSRIQQRLVALKTAKAAPKKKLREDTEEEEHFEVYGSFSQYSNRDISIDVDGKQRITSEMTLDLDLTTFYETERVDVRTQLNTSYNHEFLTRVDPNGKRVSSLYADIRDNKNDISAILGRQSSSSHGILGRFDGAILKYRYSPRWKFNVLGGYPVELSSSPDFEEPERYFLGTSVDLGTFANHWDGHAFLIQQQINSVTDRQAVGGEVRYSESRASYFTNLDYDVSFSTLNNLLASANWYLPDSLNINITYDYRTTPILTASNALIGRLENTIDDMLLTLSEDAIHQLAKDRTSVIQRVTLGGSKTLSRQLQLNGNISVSQQDGTVASGGVSAIPPSGEEYQLSLNVIGSSLIKSGDTSIVGFRYSDTRSAKITSTNLNVRYPLTRSWRASPEFAATYFDGDTGTTQLTLRPSIGVDYRWLSNITFDAEAGMIWTKDLSSSPDAGSQSDIFFELGYSIDF